MPVIFEPSKSVISICDLADKGIGFFLEAINNEHFGKYEFEVECSINITHSIRIFESIIELARKDLVYIQSGLILSRSLFETLIKVSWILHPTDIFEKEARYVAQLHTECEFWSKCIKEHEKQGTPPENFKQILNELSDFKNRLSDLLREKGHNIPKLPNVREILRSLNEEKKYLNYVLLSQYTHMSHYAGKIYRRNLGTERMLGEELQIGDWKFIFSICWPIFEFVTELYLYKTQGNEVIYSNEFKKEIRDSLNNIR